MMTDDDIDVNNDWWVNATTSILEVCSTTFHESLRDVPERVWTESLPPVRPTSERSPSPAWQTHTSFQPLQQDMIARYIPIHLHFKRPFSRWTGLACSFLVFLLHCFRVSRSLMFRFNTNMAISETKGRKWRAITAQWRKASNNLITSILAAFLFSSHPKREIGQEARILFYFFLILSLLCHALD